MIQFVVPMLMYLVYNSSGDVDVWFNEGPFQPGCYPISLLRNNGVVFLQVDIYAKIMINIINCYLPSNC